MKFKSNHLLPNPPRNEARKDANTGNDNATREKMEHILSIKEQIDRDKVRVTLTLCNTVLSI